jgi:hypothetical protein
MALLRDHRRELWQNQGVFGKGERFPAIRS